jgi:hypothetical protein
MTDIDEPSLMTHAERLADEGANVVSIVGDVYATRKHSSHSSSPPVRRATW